MKDIPGFQPEWIHSQFYNGDICDKIRLLQKTKPFAMLDLDLMSFLPKSLASLTEVLKTKRTFKEDVPLIVHLVNVEEPSRKRLSALETLNEQARGSYNALLEHLQERRNYTDLERFRDFYRLLQNVVKRAGFEFLPLGDRKLDFWNNEDRVCPPQDDIVSMLYSGEDGSSTMRYSFFILRDTRTISPHLDIPERDESIFHHVDMPDLVDATEELMDALYADTLKYFSFDPDLANREMMKAVEGKSAREVHDIVVNVLLPSNDSRKIYKWLAIHGVERSGKSFWEYLIHFIVNNTKFDKLVQMNESEHGMIGTVLQISCAPWVTWAETQKVCSSQYRQQQIYYRTEFKSWPDVKKMPTKSQMDESARKSDTYVSGQSVDKITKAQKMASMRFQERK